MRVMSSFLDDAAEESEHSEGEIEDGELSGEPPSKKPKQSSKSGKDKRKVVDSDDEEGEDVNKDDDDDDEDDEEEDEERGRKEMAGFVVDEPDEDEADADDKADKSDESGSDDSDLDEDRELVDENLGRVNRKPRAMIESDEEEGPEPADERERIEREIFAGRDDASEPGSETPSHRRVAEPAAEPEVDRSSESGESDHFIEDERGPARRHGKRRTNLPVSDEALAEAQELFGVDFNIEEFYGELDESDEGELPEEGDEEGQRQKRTRRGGVKTSLWDQMEPSEIEQKFLNERDRVIMLQDTPERFQLRRVPVKPPEEAATQEDQERGTDELSMEAMWILEKAFKQDPITDQNDEQLTARDDEHENMNDEERERILWMKEEERRAQRRPRFNETELRDKIRKALEYIRNDGFEVPFISFYRKEYVEDAKNPEDSLVINQLWKVYQWDEKWCELVNRKNSIIRLMTRTKKYHEDMKRLADMIAENEPDAPPDVTAKAPEKPLTEADIALAKEMWSLEELSDLNAWFRLHYGEDVAQVAQWERERAAAEKERQRREKGTEEGAEGDNENGNENDLDEINKVAEDLEMITFKRAKSSDPYALCLAANLGGLARKFGCEPSTLADHVNRYCLDIEGGTQTYATGGQIPVTIQKYPHMPLETAEDYTNKQFATPEMALRGACYMYAKELSLEPRFRAKVRAAYRNMCNVNVRPTPKGISEIEDFHPLYKRKYLRNKPVRWMSAFEFASLEEAQSQGLVKMTLYPGIVDRADECPTHYKPLVEQFVPYFLSDESSALAQAWNEQRRKAVTMCIEQFLVPVLTKEILSVMRQEANEFIISKACSRLYNVLSVGAFDPTTALRLRNNPGPPRENVDEFDAGRGDEDYEQRLLDAEFRDMERDRHGGYKILALTFIDGEDTTAGAVIGGDGQLIDHIRLPHFMSTRRHAHAIELRNEDNLALLDFMVKHKPHAIAFATESPNAFFAKRNLEKLILDWRNTSKLKRIVPVYFVDNDAAKVHQNSREAIAEFGDLPILTRQAVALARRLQDPLPVFCQLGGSPDKELLCVSLHPLQHQVPEEDLQWALHKEIINRVNEVGVDMNRCVEHSFLEPMLQFVCGLGPRKAAHYLKQVRASKSKVLENRTALVLQFSMGSKVFMNCAGFIKIDTNRMAERRDAYPELLDGTRIHPEHYEFVLA